jgi:hypothetical protein
MNGRKIRKRRSLQENSKDILKYWEMERQSFQRAHGRIYVFKNEQTVNFNNLKEKKDLDFDHLNQRFVVESKS